MTKKRFDVEARVYVSVEAETEEEAEQIAHDWIGVAEGHPESIGFNTLDIERVD